MAVVISPKAMDPDNHEQLERLILKAISDAQSKSQKVAEKKMKGITGGLKIPGLF
jgi:DNA-binding protein YbaB